MRGSPRGRLDGGSVGRPLFWRTRRQVRIARPLACRSIDQFAQDVRVAQMMGSFGNHVNQDLVQGDVTSVL